MTSMFIAGVICASLAPLSMTVGFIIWGENWKGSAFALNLFKCVFASILFLIISMSIRKLDISTISLDMLIVSSVLGILVGDIAWLQALQTIGARQVITFDILKPFLSAILSHFVLGETLDYTIIFGILLSSLGILIVALESSSDKLKNRNLTKMPVNLNSDHEIELYSSHDFQDDESEVNAQKSKSSPKEEIDTKVLSREELFIGAYGYTLAAVNVILDAYGTVLTKQHGVLLNTWEINLIRFGFAGLFMSSVSIFFYLLSLFPSKIMVNHKNRSISYIIGIQFSQLSVNGDSINDSNSSDGDRTVDRNGNENGNIVVNALQQNNSSVISFDSSNINDDDIVTDGSLDIDDEPVVIEKIKPVKTSWYRLPFQEMTSNDWIKISVGVIFVSSSVFLIITMIIMLMCYISLM